MTRQGRPNGQATWPFTPLTPYAYDLILADPATKFETWSAKGEAKSPQAQYETLTWDQLAALPVQRLAKRDCILVLWACWPTLKHSLQLLDDWGFRYVTGGAWHKRTRHGKSAFGCGYVLRSACEPFLIGARGSPQTSNSVRNIIETEQLDVIDAKVRDHSRKPDDQYELCHRLAPHASHFAELFARQRWPGWASWGNEVDKFTPEI